MRKLLSWRFVFLLCMFFSLGTSHAVSSQNLGTGINQTLVLDIKPESNVGLTGTGTLSFNSGISSATVCLYDSGTLTMNKCLQCH